MLYREAVTKGLRLLRAYIMTDPLETLRTAAMTSKAWPYEEARKLLKRYPEGKPSGPVIFECGKPEGP